MRFDGSSLLLALSHLENLQDVHVFYLASKNTWGTYHV